MVVRAAGNWTGALTETKSDIYEYGLTMADIKMEGKGNSIIIYVTGGLGKAAR